MSHKAIIISGFWASVVTALVISTILGGVSTAVYAYAQLEELKKSTLTLRNDIEPLKAANIPVQLAEMRGEIKGSKDITTRIEQQLQRMDNKLDSMSGGRAR